MSIQGINIWSGSGVSLAAALTNCTCIAKAKGKLQHNYPVTFRGVTYPDSEAAYKAHQQGRGPNRDNLALMIEVLVAKLQQHPAITEAVRKRGGSNWLLRCSHDLGFATRGPWEGTGSASPFIACLAEAYFRSTTPLRGGAGAPVAGRGASEGCGESGSREARAELDI